MVQWLGFCAFTAEGAGSIPGRGTKIPQAVGCSQNNNNSSSNNKNNNNIISMYYGVHEVHMGYFPKKHHVSAISIGKLLQTDN